MDGKRAVEIMESHGVIGVLFNGKPVWLENIKDQIADAILIESGDRIEVPLDKLKEGSASNQRKNV